MKNRFIQIEICLLFLLFFSINMVFGQKAQNSIFIWDVTASMVGTTNPTPPNYGYKKEADIDSEVRKGLEDIINEIRESTGEIIILPFGTEIWETQRFKSNKKGKHEAINYIKNYKIGKQPVGYTNICSAWDNAIQYIDPQKENLIYLFTDGEQNISYGALNKDECLKHIVEKYCKQAEGKEIFTFFISLNLADNSFSNILNNACSKHLKYVPLKDVRDHGVQVPAILVARFDPLTINLHDDTPMAIERFMIKGGNVPDNFTVVAVLEGIQQHLDIKAKVIKQEDNKIDVEFSLEDIDGRTIEDLKRDKTLKLTGTIILNHESVYFEPPVLNLNIINKEAQRLIFNIK